MPLKQNFVIPYPLEYDETTHAIILETLFLQINHLMAGEK